MASWCFSPNSTTILYIIKNISLSTLIEENVSKLLLALSFYFTSWDSSAFVFLKVEIATITPESYFLFFLFFHNIILIVNFLNL